MEKVIAYKAFNGRLFDSEEKCLVYEKKLSQYPKVKESVDVARLVVRVIEPNKKWEIDNPSWHSGAVAPYTFTMEKLD